jgi:hypothetical protein
MCYFPHFVQKLFCLLIWSIICCLLNIILMDSSWYFGCCFEIIMWWFLLSFHITVRKPTWWLTSISVGFWSTAVLINFISTYGQFRKSCFPLAVNTSVLGPEYLWVACHRSGFRSALGVLFPQYPLYLESVPLSATWGGARWRVTDNPTWDYYAAMQQIQMESCQTIKRLKDVTV